MSSDFMPAPDGLINALVCIILITIGVIGTLITAGLIKLAKMFYEYLKDEGVFDVILDGCIKAYRWLRRKIKR